MVFISVELSGGLELLFGKQKRFPRIELPNEPLADMRQAMQWIRKHLLQERPDLFMAGDTVRPGILVLINDCDWELEGKLDYQLQDGDVVTFISTLHGG